MSRESHDQSCYLRAHWQLDDLVASIVDDEIKHGSPSDDPAKDCGEMAAHFYNEFFNKPPGEINPNEAAQICWWLAAAMQRLMKPAVEEIRNGTTQ